MEKAIKPPIDSCAVKPPWILAATQWQRRQRASWPETLTFSPWVANSSTALQAAKERISILEASHRWELVKKMVNPYEMVYTHEDKHFHPSIAVIKPLSRSYFKLIEMLDVLQFFEGLPKQTPKIRTAHIAEGPGGFIQAIVDITERNKKILQTATAMTLKPTDQRVPGWRRASSFLHHHAEVKLHFGIDGTGDVYQLGNQDSFVETVRPGVHLFTADGGFDFSINYDIQEQRVYHLLVCSATIGLRSLLLDGSFILKLFDIFSESSMILIGLMARCFKEWMLYKPALSRPCNSERYFLGRGFKGLTPAVFECLLEIQKQSLGELYPAMASDILGKEFDYIKEYIATNTNDQLTAIGIAEKYAVNPEVWYSTQLLHDFHKSLSWCQKFRVPFIMTIPVVVHPVVYTSELGVGPQLQLPDDDSTRPAPCGLTLPA